MRQNEIQKANNNQTMRSCCSRDYIVLPSSWMYNYAISAYHHH